MKHRERENRCTLEKRKDKRRKRKFFRHKTFNRAHMYSGVDGPSPWTQTWDHFEHATFYDFNLKAVEYFGNFISQ